MPRRTALLLWLLLCALLAAAGPAVGEEPASFRFAAIADTHMAEPAHLAAFRQFLFTIQDEKPEFLLILGDICGHQPEYLPRIKEIIDASGLRVHALPGNHDDNYARNPEWYEPVFGRMYYSFDHKGWHFVMNWSQSQPLDWLRADLAGTDPETPVVFCQHYPPGEEGPAEEPWKSLLSHPNVKVALSGHYHRWGEQQLGHISSYTLDACFFTGGRNPGSYYLVEALPGEGLSFHSSPIADLALKSPPDDLPTVVLERPENGAVLRGRADLTGAAADDGTIARVEYRLDRGVWRAAEGLADWQASLDTTALSDGHHLLEVRAIDDAGQPSITYASSLVFVRNTPPNPKTYSFQQGVNGYAGCTGVTVHKHESDTSDLECWVWRGGDLEFSEFYLRFDLSHSGVPMDGKIKRAALTLYCNRQNFQSVGENTADYLVGVMRQPWTEDITFATRPARPGWFVPDEPSPAPDLAGSWPVFGGVQNVYPPQAVRIDLMPIAAEIAGWLRDPDSNYGLVFSPAAGVNYNMSVASTTYPMATCRPNLEIEIE